MKASESLTVQSKCRKTGRIAPTTCEAIRYEDYWRFIIFESSLFPNIIVLPYVTTLLCFQGPRVGPYAMQDGIMLEPEAAARPPLSRTRFALQRNAKRTVLERQSKQLVPFVFSTKTMLTNKYMKHTALQEILKQNSGYKGLSQLLFHCFIAESSSCFDLLPDPNPQPKTPSSSVTKSTAPPQKTNKILPCSPQSYEFLPFDFVIHLSLATHNFQHAYFSGWEPPPKKRSMSLPFWAEVRELHQGSF